MRRRNSCSISEVTRLMLIWFNFPPLLLSLLSRFSLHFSTFRNAHQRFDSRCTHSDTLPSGIEKLADFRFTGVGIAPRTAMPTAETLAQRRQVARWTDRDLDVVGKAERVVAKQQAQCARRMRKPNRGMKRLDASPDSAKSQRVADSTAGPRLRPLAGILAKDKHRKPLSQLEDFPMFSAMRSDSVQPNQSNKQILRPWQEGLAPSRAAASRIHQELEMFEKLMLLIMPSEEPGSENIAYQAMYHTAQERWCLGVISFRRTNSGCPQASILSYDPHPSRNCERSTKELMLEMFRKDLFSSAELDDISPNVSKLPLDRSSNLLSQDRCSPIATSTETHCQ